MRLALAALLVLLHPEAALAVDPSGIESGSLRGAPIEPTGECDERAINAAIAALPPAGGKVELGPGTFDICRGDSPLGGILIDRSNVDLGGAGPATLLRLADGQNTNVIRILGAGTRNVRIHDIACDGNRGKNDAANEEELRFEANCARAGGIEEPKANIVFERVFFFDCARLCILGVSDEFGERIVVRNSRFGDAGSDVVELAGYGGLIAYNEAVISARTGHVFGGDAQNGLSIIGNRVVVKSSGEVTVTAFRTYPGHYSTKLINNTVVVEEGGFIENVVNLQSYLNIVTGNDFLLRRRDGVRSKMRFNGGTIIANNAPLASVELVFDDTSVTENDPDGLGAIITRNLLVDATLPAGPNVEISGNRMLD